MNVIESGCPDVMIMGNCTRGQDCGYCNGIGNSKINKEMDNDVNSNNLIFNVNAKKYVPKGKRNENISDNNNSENSNKFGDIKFNLNANEYKPKFLQNNQNMNHFSMNENFNDEDFNFNDDDNDEEFDMIMKDIINNEIEEDEQSDESDVDKWYPKYKNCGCCKGYVNKCSGNSCLNLGSCICKMQDDCDPDEN